jgi:hypothetical protein
MSDVAEMDEALKTHRAERDLVRKRLLMLILEDWVDDDTAYIAPERVN